MAVSARHRMFVFAVQSPTIQDYYYLKTLSENDKVVDYCVFVATGKLNISEDEGSFNNSIQGHIRFKDAKTHSAAAKILYPIISRSQGHPELGPDQYTGMSDEALDHSIESLYPYKKNLTFKQVYNYYRKSYIRYMTSGTGKFYCFGTKGTENPGPPLVNEDI